MKRTTLLASGCLLAATLTPTAAVAAAPAKAKPAKDAAASNRLQNAVTPTGIMRHERKGLASEATAFDGRSDYGPFIATGIPAGGLFSGAEGIKTPEHAAKYGGTAGAPFDACYHQACDTLANLNQQALAEFLRRRGRRHGDAGPAHSGADRQRGQEGEGEREGAAVQGPARGPVADSAEHPSCPPMCGQEECSACSQAGVTAGAPNAARNAASSATSIA